MQHSLGECGALVQSERNVLGGLNLLIAIRVVATAAAYMLHWH